MWTTRRWRWQLARSEVLVGVVLVDQRGDELAGRFRIDEKLGSGGFAVAYRVFDSYADTTRVLKIITKDRRSTFQRLKQEYRVLERLKPHGNVVRVVWADKLPDETPSGAQGWFINTRRDKFKDPRVRQALGDVFDFEWSNNKLFYKLYTRTQSFFENSDMKAKGKPSPEELALLEPFKDKLAPEVFGEPYSPPTTDGTGNNRESLKRAYDLLTAAGWKLGSDRLARNAKGETLDMEILFFEDAFERIITPYIENLKKVGVNATARRVDPAQYERRRKSFDYDMSIERYSLRLTPGVELRSYWGSESAKMDGSQNLSGIADPVVDALIEKVVVAKSRAELLTATHAIDRVLRAGHYWVPHWYKASHNVAYWDKFSRPEKAAKYDPGILDTWWFDDKKAAALASKAAPAGNSPSDNAAGGTEGTR